MNSLPFPIWALCFHKDSILISGGGGGKAYGVKNMLALYKAEIPLKTPIKEEDTGTDLVGSLEWLKKIDIIIAGIRKDILIIKISPKSDIEKLHRIQCEESKSISYIKGSADNTMLLEGADEGSIKLWRINSGDKSLAKIVEMEHNSSLTGIDIMPNNKMVCATFKDKTCRIYEIPSGLYAKTLYFSRKCDPQGLMFKGCYFSEKNDYLYTIQTGLKAGSYFTKWDVNKGFHPINTVQIHNGQSCVLKGSKSGKYAAIGTSDGSLKIINTQNLSVLYSKLEFSLPVTALDFSASEKSIFAGSADYAYKRIAIKESSSFLLYFILALIIAIIIPYLFY